MSQIGQWLLVVNLEIISPHQMKTYYSYCSILIEFVDPQNLWLDTNFMNIV